MFILIEQQFISTHNPSKLIKMKPKSKQIDIKEGFFPSFVYLLPSQAIRQEDYIQKIRTILLENKIQFKAVQQLHLSLSKTFYPIYTEIANITARLRTMLQQKRKTSLPIILLFKRVQILQNFITLTVEKVTEDRLMPIVSQVEKITKEAYYEAPVFHISLFKIQSEVSQQVLKEILAVKIEPKKSYILKDYFMRSGKVIYDLNA